MNKATKQLSKSLAIIVILTFIVTSAIPAGAISVSPNPVSVRVGSKVETNKNTPAKIIGKVKETTKKVLDGVGILSENKKSFGIGESNEAIANRLITDPRLNFRTKAKVELSLKMNTLDREVLLDIEKSLEGTVTSPNFYNKRTKISNIANIGDYTFMGGTGFDTMYGGEKSSYDGFENWTIRDFEAYDSNFLVVTGEYYGRQVNKVAIFDGEKWNFYEFSKPQGFDGVMGTYTSLTLARDDIYVGGLAGFIYHFDGNTWELQNYYPGLGHNVQKILKASDGNLYAIADEASLWKQNTDKKTWTLVDISGGVLPTYSFSWDADEYNGKIYFLNDNNTSKNALASYDIYSGEVEVLSENIDTDRYRYVYGIHVKSSSEIYLTGSSFSNQQELGTAAVYKYNGSDIVRIVAEFPESDTSVILQSIAKDPLNDDLWVAGEKGALGKIDTITDEMIMEPIDFNGDGTRDRKDWFDLPSVTPRIGEMYLTAVFYVPSFSSSVIRFGSVNQPTIDFKNLKSVYRSGEEMDISLEIDNLGGNYEEVDVYIAMEIPGDPNLYYFWPTWREGLNKKNIRLASGEVTDESVLHFTLPDNLPAFGPLNLYAILTAPQNFGLFSNVEVGQFSLAP